MAFVSSFALSPVARRPRVRLCPLRNGNSNFTCRSLHTQLRLSECGRAGISRARMVSTHMDDGLIHSSNSSRSQIQPTPTPTRRHGRAVAAAIASLAAAFALTGRSNISNVLSRLISMSTEIGIVRGATLIAGINFCTVLLCFPANMGLMIGAGAVLGPLPAFLALFLSKVAAACVAFLLARSVLFDRVEKWLQRYPKISSVLLDSGREGGWKFVLLMRLSPFPGFLLNYLLSLTGVSFLEYTVGTLVGTAPSVANLVLMGATVRDVGVGAAGGTVSGGWLGLAIKGLCMLSMVVVTVLITRRARRAFAQVEEGNFDNAKKPVDT